MQVDVLILTGTSRNVPNILPWALNNSARTEPAEADNERIFKGNRGQFRELDRLRQLVFDFLN